MWRGSGPGIDAGDRAGFYLAYHDMTGSNQALTQAQVSSYSETISWQAIYSNATARSLLTLTGRGDLYPGTTDNLSLIIATDLLNRIDQNVAAGGSGVFSDREVFRFAADQWAIRGIGDVFPGAMVDPDFGFLQYPFSSLVVNAVGSLAVGSITTVPFDAAVPISAQSPIGPFPNHRAGSNSRP
jgi:hypothetical protein